MDKGIFFMTGVTGLLGTEVVSQLLAMTDCCIRVLVRASSQADAVHRLQALWWEDETLSSAIGQRIIPVVGDITKERLGLGYDEWKSVVCDTTHVIHCAAETGVLKSKDELWEINVEGTRRVVRLAEEIKSLHRFTYVSTAYVAGTQSGLIREDAPLPLQFYSLYEQSKAEAEKIVRASVLPLTICRPGMIVGNTRTGRARNFNTVYYVLKLVLQGKIRCFPVQPTQTVNVIPVDYVAHQVATLTLHPQALGKTFHLTAPAAQLPQVKELVEEVRIWAKNNLHIHVARPIYLPLSFLRSVGKRYNAGKEEKGRNLFSNLTALMPYFLDDHLFDRTNTLQLANEYDWNWRKYLPTLLEFACRHNFMRLTDRSIFEQAVFRRKSRRHPITYYDITRNGMERVTGREMNAVIHHYVRQLNEWGIKPGDKVALSGINCVEHVAIDQAIGLIGATSVPVYYTTPGEEMALLLRKSGAHWFFVGDERIMQNADMIDHEIKVIPFGPLKERASIAPQPHPDIPVIDTRQVATIRYTSGTTGEPKGVMFSFNQLKWMGESLAHLLPWKDRNREMRYLSFLPMSHVVEGILAAYAPYCMLCKTKIYYLNDFSMLTQALPKVRPTVFFSVPRFYEKLWEQIERHPLGKRYLRMNDGCMKMVMAKLLRKAVLKKAGLDQCSQLIVGSAPVSEELLLRFRTLGIEIHNAYGQTEAPLITINRLGDNAIPSIGTPLPDTIIRVNPDGELIVQGPQVALGYYQLESGTFQNGTLYTGDLGSLDTDGHITLKGRKKDMLITSYGKNINRGKIEQRLKDIPGVEQAVLIGEQRPYCAALLWISGKEDSLEESIRRMNSTLSRPEQVKQWRVIRTPLSIKNGELTPNLKVKRHVVENYYQSVIDSMYENH